MLIIQMRRGILSSIVSTTREPAPAGAANLVEGLKAAGLRCRAASPWSNRPGIMSLLTRISRRIVRIWGRQEVARLMPFAIASDEDNEALASCNDVALIYRLGVLLI